MKSILIIDGHPDPDGARYGHAAAQAYADAARTAGHVVTVLAVSSLPVALLRSRHEWEAEAPPAAIGEAQQRLSAADHLVIIYPLWLGSMPAILKGFLEQLFRPGFAFDNSKPSLTPGRLKGKSARIIVTMGMPGFVYRWFFMAHSLKSLERNILRFVGIGPVRHTIIGNIEAAGNARAGLERVKSLGLRAM